MKPWCLILPFLALTAIAKPPPQFGMTKLNSFNDEVLFPERFICPNNAEPIYLGLSFLSGMPNREKTIAFFGFDEKNPTQGKPFFLYDTAHDEKRVRLDVCVDSETKQVILNRAVITIPDLRKVYAITYSENTREVNTNFFDSADSSQTIYQIQAPRNLQFARGLSDLVFESNYTNFLFVTAVPDVYIKFILRYGNLHTKKEFSNEDFLIFYEGDSANSTHLESAIDSPLSNFLLAGKLPIVDETYLFNTNCALGGSLDSESTFPIQDYAITSMICNGGKLNGTSFFYVSNLQIKKNNQMLVDSRDPKEIGKYYKIVNSHHNQCDAHKIKIGNDLEYYSNSAIRAIFKSGDWDISKNEKSSNGLILNCPDIPERFDP